MRLLLSAFIVALALSIPIPAHADLLPPGWEKLQQRIKDGGFDVADQFCRDKKVGEACAIPGNSFEGGGQGICRAQLRRNWGEIRSACVLDDPAHMERVVDGEWWAERCTALERVRSQLPNATCEPKPPIADQFCAGKSAGDDCTAEVWVKAGMERYSGKCVQFRNTSAIMFHPGDGERLLRDEIHCRPEHPVRRIFGKP
ncbi:hypothetical protein CU669_19150 [Paramagnetospirillum kuznetsovii]|uniref:Uncharacterized protein n=1 Tax=Paramagnetospirillum kuznetsovii TaxID=2053833 RepID=A0A364NTP5_9PROT|nr:hypothetical protein [Paramagnetospirillum kuznetsovii]RAU20285.1 hypothetical protein CU669_19150 [Paramagnetospirillum kuznetsovii]